MIKYFIVLGMFLFSLCTLAKEENYRQWIDIDFDDMTANDALNNGSASLLNGAAIVNDAERSGGVLQVSAENKSCLKLNDIILPDTLTIAFWGKREDTDPSQNWRMFFALYADDGSNIYLTPKTTWNANSYLIIDNKPYANYKSLPGISIENGKWYHWAVTFFNGNVKFYINGILQTEFVSLFKLSDFRITKFFFGNHPDLNFPMSGKIDEIKMYRYALYENQILALSEGKALPEPSKPVTPSTPAILCTADMNVTHQTIHNFGASDGWNTQFVGLHFPQDKKERLAELLFSVDTFPDGAPKGIGLSAWRFNIGAGTSEQGEASRISFYSRRTECFLNPDQTTYDWNKQAGQKWFLEKAALQYGVNDIIGWQNSPPVYFTVRGLGFREYGDNKSSILRRENYSAFAQFLADVITHFKEQNIHFKYISPLNEPQWDWSPTAAGGTVSQEGTPWMNQEIWEVVKTIGNTFADKNINAKLFIPEAGSLDYILNESAGYYGKQLYHFWNPSGIYSLVDVPSFSGHVSTHSYWTDASAENIVAGRRKLRDQIKALNSQLDYWQTEYSLLGNGYKFGHHNGTSRLLTPMECGISLARIIHNDMTEADCTAWQWWTTFEFDSKAGSEERFALIRFEINPNQNDGIYRTTKLLYTLGNFSRFIRPGMKRIALERSDAMDAVEAVTKQMISAYTDNEQVVIVAINASTEAVALRLNWRGLPGSVGNVVQWKPYLTSNDPYDNLKSCPLLTPDNEFVMPPTSVVTFVGKIESSGNEIKETQQPHWIVYPNPATEQITVSSAQRIKQITLSNISGKIVKQINVNDHSCTIPLNGLAEGIYLSITESDNHKSTQKIIIK
jgi:O-glycosyl hydrolase